MRSRTRGRLHPFRSLYRLLGRATLAALLLAGSAASGAPLLSVDLDPESPGVQANAVLERDSTLTLAIVVSDVEAAEPLHGFELELVFSAAVAAPVSAELGDFLVAPFLTLENAFAPGAVGLAAVTLGPGAAFGDGTLALLTLEAIGVGTTALSPTEVLLSRPGGVAIPGVLLADASVMVVPEPAPALLIALGLFGSAANARLRGSRR